MSNSILPIILYKLDGSVFGTTDIYMQSPCLYFYSYQNFDVKIISGTGTLYSVLLKTNPDGDKYLETKDGQEFISKVNFGYTLYVPTDKTTVTLLLTSMDGVSSIYKFTLNLINQESEETEHYNDLIINNYLPTLEELQPALLPGTERSEILKRMLLDFKHIMRTKGTKKSIEKFFYFIGFLKEQLKVSAEYKKLKSGNKDNLITITPNKLTDSKTGNYHVLYNNWDDGEQEGKQELNKKNLPYRPYATEDFDALFESLKYAIPLANKYFTLVEQEITFFGICFSSNIPLYPSIVPVFNHVFINDTCDFRKDIHIDVSYFNLTQKQTKVQTFLVKNCLQNLSNAYRSEIKYVIKENIKTINQELYLVEREIPDDEEYDESLTPYRRSFGSLLHIDVLSPQTYVKVTIRNRLNELSKIVIDTQFITEKLNIQFVTEKTDIYDIEIDVTDSFGTRERYTYTYIIGDNISLIDIDTFNSLLMVDINQKHNQIDLDVDSGTITTKALATSRNYILPIDIIPEDLSYYWKIVPEGQLHWLTHASDSVKEEQAVQHILPPLNKNFKLTEVTDTIPLELTEQWLELLVMPYTDKLKLRVFNVKKGVYEIMNIEEALVHHDQTFDRLFVRTMNITDADTTITTKYLFITTTETGIDFNKKSFDLIFDVDNKSVYDYMGKENDYFVNIHRIPVNYDFPLFPIIGDESLYHSLNTYQEIIGGISYPVVKSMFPRMINITSDKLDEMSILMQGDVILSRINQNYIVNESNVIWNVFNAFTNELLFTTNDYMLKYRIDDITCYTITCDFDIDSFHHKIVKTGIFTSFKL